MSIEIEKLRSNIAKSVNNAFYSDEGNKKPMNRLWIALIAFNVIFFPLDVATGFTVGLITRWYYGLFVFGAGFGTMVLHEALYSNPYAGKLQKGISIFGFLVSVSITVLIGLAAIAINILVDGYDRELYGAIMAGVSFVVLFLHGLLFAVYYFTDHGILTKQRSTATEAKHVQTMEDFSRAESMADMARRLEERLIARIEEGDSVRMNSALNKLTGEDWIDVRQNPPAG